MRSLPPKDYRLLPPRNPSRLWRNIASLILSALIIFVAGSMTEEDGRIFSGILERFAAPTATPTNTPEPTDTPTDILPTATLTDTPTDAPPTATLTDTPTDAPPTATLTATDQPAPTATAAKYVVETARNLNANIRACPRTSCDIVAKLPAGAPVEVLGSVTGETVNEIDVWFEIKLEGGSAYIHRELAEVSPLSQPSSLSASLERFTSSSRKYTRSWVNVRTGPGTHYPLLDSVPAGTALEVVGKSGVWYLIRRGGREVYVAARLTSDAPLPVSREANQSRVSSPVDNCCFIGWQCNTEDEWKNGYIAFQNNQCKGSSQPAQAISPQPRQSSQQQYSCNCSKTCGQMASCREAYFQLDNCGCGRRDDDGDGVPCESICR